MNLKRTIRPQDISTLFMQMGLLLDSGVGILECMQSVQTQNTSLAIIIQDIVKNLHQGLSLTQSIAQHKTIFGELSCALLTLGQESGTLPAILLTLSAYFNKRAQTKALVTKALVYPSILLCAMIVAFLAIIWFVIPPFMVLFAELGTTLPLYTRVLVWLYESLQTFGLLIIVVLVCIAFASKILYAHQSSFRHTIDTYILRIPFVGALITSQEAYRFSFALSYMLKGAMPLDKALPLASLSVQNRALRERYNMLLPHIKNTAATLSQALKTLGLLDPVSITLIHAGEKSAKLPQIFESIANATQRESEQKLDMIVRLIEPTLSLIMGALVVFLALGVFVPMWDMSANIL